MIYQDRRALVTVRRGIMWLASLAAASPLVHAVDTNVWAVGVLGAVVSLLAVYVMLLVVVR